MNDYFIILHNICFFILFMTYFIILKENLKVGNIHTNAMIHVSRESIQNKTWR
jgi:hypothetical protein